MQIRLFSLRSVPDDEAEEIRALLTANGIDYYETPAGNWGMSVPAIWLNDEGQAPKARMLLEQYQRERAVRMRNEYAQLQREGRQRTIMDLVRQNPVQVIIYLAAIAAVIYFSIMPFVNLGTDQVIKNSTL
jgi:hypothetical protein